MMVCELYRQQKGMLDSRTHTCEDRIVSLRQPHVRPIVRGKAGKRFEFGQKLALSVVNGLTFIERQSFNNFNEGITLSCSVMPSLKLLKLTLRLYRFAANSFPPFNGLNIRPAMKNAKVIKSVTKLTLIPLP